MLSLNGVSAWIEVDGKELEQYGVEEELDQKQATCWIATHAGKAFSVVFRDNATYRDHSLASMIKLDGSSMAGRLLVRSPSMMASFSNYPTPCTIVQKDQVVSATSSRPFVFSKLELTDEDEYLGQASKHLGEIQISIYRVQPLENDLSTPVASVHSQGKVHERSKKAVSHCVSYGPEVKTSTNYTWQVRYLDGNTPLATFTFKYRDYSLLQANAIIAKPPSAGKKRAVLGEALDLTTSDDVKREPEEIEVLDKVASATKRSNFTHASETRHAKRIKQRGKSIPTGEVIDLT